MSHDASPSPSVSRVIASGQLRSVFQPIVDLRSGRIIAVEALTRVDPLSGFAHAGELFDAASAQGAVRSLDSAAQEVSVRTVSESKTPAMLFLNCSPAAIADGSYADEIVARVCATPDLSPSRVVLEITERSDAQHIRGLSEQVERLRGAGFQIAIDDVGAGASGLNRIMRLRPGWLKLDRELVDRIDQDNVKQNMVRFMLHFSKLSGVRMIVEGIEREEELLTLVRLGVRYGQGFLLGRPGEIGPLDAAVEHMIARVMRAAEHDLLVRSSATAGSVAQSPPCLDEGTDLTSLEDLTPVLEDQPGVVVTKAGSPIGWIGADRLRGVLAVRAAEGTTLGSICGRRCVTIEADAPLTEALSLAASRPAGDLHLPLIVQDHERPPAVLTTERLMLAAAEHARATEVRSDAVTGLPGPVLCFQQVSRLCHAAGEPVASETAIAFIDIRNFQDFNGMVGYELGDELIRELARTTTTAIEEAGLGRHEAFLGHQGKDRFLLTAPSGAIEAVVRTVADRFGDRVLGLVGLSDGAGGGALSEVSLRGLVATRAFASGRSAKSVLRLETVLRRLADERVKSREHRGPVIVLHDDTRGGAAAA